MSRARYTSPTGRHLLVMELVEGESLDARIAAGPIPLEEALPIARQIAEACLDVILNFGKSLK